MRQASELSAMAIALRAEIEALLSDEPRGIFLDAMKDAEVAVDRFVELGACEDGIGALAELRAALAIASEAIPESSDGSTASALDESLAWLERMRSLTVDCMARAPCDAGSDTSAVHEGTPPVHHAQPALPSELLGAAARAAREEALATDGEELARQTEQLAHDALDAIGSFGSARLLEDEQAWAECKAAEQALLQNLDLLWSLDKGDRKTPRMPVPRALVSYARSWPSPDWGRSFAFAFGLACCDSLGALRCVFSEMRSADARALDAFEHALALASHPGLDTALAELLCADVSSEVLLGALTVAKRRRSFHAGAMLPLLGHPDARVAVAVVRCLPSAPRSAGLALLERLTGSPHPTVALAALEEHCLLGVRRERMRAVLEQSLSGAAPLDSGLVALQKLALAGDEGDAERVLGAGLALDGGLEWIGWFGCPSHVEIVLAELSSALGRGPAGAVRARLAARAVLRITGVDSSRDVSIVRAEALTVAAHSGARRLRHGKPHGTASVLTELAAGSTRQADRRLLATELAMIVPLAPRIDVDGWFAQQGLELSQISRAAGC